MAKTKTSSKVKDRYNRKAYDDLRVRLPKGQKATIQSAADGAQESVNQFTQKALLQRMHLDDWPVLPQTSGHE